MKSYELQITSKNLTKTSNSYEFFDTCEVINFTAERLSLEAGRGGKPRSAYHVDITEWLLYSESLIDWVPVNLGWVRVNWPAKWEEIEEKCAEHAREVDEAVDLE